MRLALFETGHDSFSPQGTDPGVACIANATAAEVADIGEVFEAAGALSAEAFPHPPATRIVAREKNERDATRGIRLR